MSIIIGRPLASLSTKRAMRVAAIQPIRRFDGAQHARHLVSALFIFVDVLFRRAASEWATSTTGLGHGPLRLVQDLGSPQVSLFIILLTSLDL